MLEKFDPRDRSKNEYKKFNTQKSLSQNEASAIKRTFSAARNTKKAFLWLSDGLSLSLSFSFH